MKKMLIIITILLNSIVNLKGQNQCPNLLEIVDSNYVLLYFNNASYIPQESQIGLPPIKQTIQFSVTRKGLDLKILVISSLISLDTSNYYWIYKAKFNDIKIISGDSIDCIWVIEENTPKIECCNFNYLYLDTVIGITPTESFLKYKTINYYDSTLKMIEFPKPNKIYFKSIIYENGTRSFKKELIIF